MATRDSGGQSQSGKARRDAEIEDDAAPAVDPEVAERQEKLTEDVDDLLDEIDSVLEGYREREELGWASPKLQLVDLQYADVRPEKGLYHRLVARGAMQTLFDQDQVRYAMAEPPEDTRAYFRGRCLAQYGSEVVAASWDSVIFDVGRDSLVRVPMMEPERGTKAHVGALFDKCPSAKDLLEAITTT